METETSSVILVVDDSPDTLRMLTDALDAASMTVMVALDGASAMRIVERITPDVILLDAVMPGMDGFEVKQRMPVREGQKIYALSADSTEETREKCQAAGFDAVLFKPVGRGDLIALGKVGVVARLGA